MHISRLSIRNYRCFGEKTFEIDLKPFTLVLGENNVGKTNLVSAASLLFGGDLSAPASRRLALDDFNYTAVNSFKQQVANKKVPLAEINFPEVIVEADLEGMNELQHAVVADWYDGPDLNRAKVTYRFALRGGFDRDKWVTQQREGFGSPQSTTTSDLIDLPIGDYRPLVYGGGSAANECDSYLLRMLRVECLDALRDANRELIAGGEQKLLYRILRQQGSSQYEGVKRALSAVKTAVDQDVALETVKRSVSELLESVSLKSDTGDNKIEFDFSQPDAAELLKNVGLVYGTDPITVERNGLGRNNLLYLALVLSQIARTDHPDEAQEGYSCFRLVGVEEPESHLHPHLQDHLATNIEELQRKHADSLQLVLTSHSTHLAAKTSLEHTVIIRRDKDGGLRPHYVLTGIDPQKDKHTVRFLSLYLDATKSRLLFARKVVLVEGIAELLLIPLLFRQHNGKTLESIGASVVSVDGIAFRHFLELAKNGLHDRSVVLTDSDTGTDTDNRATDLRSDYDDGDTIAVKISHKSTFEKDLIDSNASGDQKELMLRALERTRRNKGKQYRDNIGTKDLDVETVFAMIKDHKAEFAYNLASVLTENDEPDVPKKKKKAAKKKDGKKRVATKTLTVPGYIAEGFAFIDE